MNTAQTQEKTDGLYGTVIATYELVCPRPIWKTLSSQELKLVEEFREQLTLPETIANHKAFLQDCGDENTYLLNIAITAWENRYQRAFENLSSLFADPTGKTLELVLTLDDCEPQPDCFVEVQTNFGNFFVGLATNTDTKEMSICFGKDPLKDRAKDLYIALIGTLGYGLPSRTHD